MLRAQEVRIALLYAFVVLVNQLCKRYLFIYLYFSSLNCYRYRTSNSPAITHGKKQYQNRKQNQPSHRTLTANQTVLTPSITMNNTITLAFFSYHYFFIFLSFYFNFYLLICFDSLLFFIHFVLLFPFYFLSFFSFYRPS